MMGHANSYFVMESIIKMLASNPVQKFFSDEHRVRLTDEGLHFLFFYINQHLKYREKAHERSGKE